MPHRVTTDVHEALGTGRPWRAVSVVAVGAASAIAIGTSHTANATALHPLSPFAVPHAGAAVAGNAVTVHLPGTSTRYLRLTFTVNTAWPAGLLSELQAFGS